MVHFLILEHTRVFLLFKLGLKSAWFHFPKHKKSFLLRKHNLLKNLRDRKFHSLKYKEFFLRWVFSFLKLGPLKVQGSMSKNIRYFLILEPKSSISQNIRNFLSRWSFLFCEIGLKKCRVQFLEI